MVEANTQSSRQALIQARPAPPKEPLRCDDDDSSRLPLTEPPSPSTANCLSSEFASFFSLGASLPARQDGSQHRGNATCQTMAREARSIQSMAGWGSTHRNISPACPRACSPRLGDRSAGSRPAPLWEDCKGNTFQRMPCHRTDVGNP